MLKKVNLNDREFLRNIQKIDKKFWGKGGINEWLLHPLVKNGLVFGWLKEDKLIGYGIFYREVLEKESLFLYDFVIDSDYQGKGYGKVFFKEIVKYVYKNKLARRLTLTVSPHNKKALSIYKNYAGMKTKEYLEDFYGSGEDRLWLEGIVEEMITKF